MKNPSLDEFARQHGGRRTTRWCDTLPEDIQAQIRNSDASTMVIVRWLQSLGYDSSYGRVDTWRRAERDRPTDAG